MSRLRICAVHPELELAIREPRTHARIGAHASGGAQHASGFVEQDRVTALQDIQGTDGVQRAREFGKLRMAAFAVARPRREHAAMEFRVVAR